MISLTPVSLNSVAVIGAHCDDIAIGAGATLMEIVRDKPDVVVHALVLTGGGTEREVEEKDALPAICPSTDVRLTVAGLPDGRLPDQWEMVKQHVAAFRRECQPDMVFGPHVGCSAGLATPKPSRWRKRF
jgi:LmbE family N-acetylglucosaminyl deacetylase